MKDDLTEAGIINNTIKLNETFTEQDFMQFILDYVEEIKELLSSDIWENIFLNCSKNEVFVFWLLYRRKEVNMTEIADYIHVPLNTATGIVSRMEKDGLLVRERSEEDKRVVNIRFSAQGAAQFEALLAEIMYYGMKVISALSKEETDIFYKMTTKIIEVLKQGHKKDETGKSTQKRVRKIRID